jgi:hypothetical protein
MNRRGTLTRSPRRVRAREGYRIALSNLEGGRIGVAFGAVSTGGWRRLHAVPQSGHKSLYDFTQPVVSHDDQIVSGPPQSTFQFADGDGFDPSAFAV